MNKIEIKQLEYIDYQFSVEDEDGGYNYQGIITRPADKPLTESELEAAIDAEYQNWRAVMEAPVKDPTVAELAAQEARLEKEVARTAAKLETVRTARLALSAEPVVNDDIKEVKRG